MRSTSLFKDLKSLKFDLYCTLCAWTLFCICFSNASYSSIAPPFSFPSPRLALSIRICSIFIFNPLIAALASFTFKPAKHRQTNREQQQRCGKKKGGSEDVFHNKPQRDRCLEQWANDTTLFVCESLTRFFRQIIT